MPATYLLCVLWIPLKGTLMILWISPKRVAPRSSYLPGQPLCRSPLVNIASLTFSYTIISLVVCLPSNKLSTYNTRKIVYSVCLILTGYLPEIILNCSSIISWNLPISICKLDWRSWNSSKPPPVNIIRECQDSLIHSQPTSVIWARLTILLSITSAVPIRGISTSISLISFYLVLIFSLTSSSWSPTSSWCFPRWPTAFLFKNKTF